MAEFTPYKPIGGTVQNQKTTKPQEFTPYVPSSSPLNNANNVSQETKPQVIQLPTTPPKQPILTRVSDFLAGAVQNPTYSTGSTKELLMNLPGEIVRTILPGAAAISDNPTEFASISNKDILKEIPGAVFETFVAPVASYPLTFAGIGNQIVGKAPEISFEFKIPGLPTPIKIDNVQSRIAQDYSVQAPSNSKLSTAIDVFKYTGQEILNGLFTASMVQIPFAPRTEAVTPKGKVNIPKTEGTFEAPKTGQLYEKPIITKPIQPEVFQKITAENGIPVKTTYNPSNPLFFRAESFTGDNQALGQFFQVKPSYVDELLSLIKKGKSPKVPDTQIVPVSTLYKNITPTTDSINGVPAKLTPIETPVVPFKPVETISSKTPKTEPIQTPTDQFKQEAVKLIKGYVERGDSLKSIKDGQLGSAGGEVSVSVGGYSEGKKISSDNIIVQINGETKTFKLKNIYDEIKSGTITETKKPEVPKEVSYKKTYSALDTELEQKIEKLQKKVDETKNVVDKMDLERELRLQKELGNYDSGSIDINGQKIIPGDIISAGLGRIARFDSLRSNTLDYRGNKNEGEYVLLRDIGDNSPFLLPKDSLVIPSKERTISEYARLKYKKPDNFDSLIEKLPSNPEDNTGSIEQVFSKKNDSTKPVKTKKSVVVKSNIQETNPELEKVTSNLLKNNPGLSKTEAKAMAKDVIANRKFNSKNNSKSFASIDKFREDVKPVEDKIKNDVKPIEFPELVRLSKELIGQYPEVKLPRPRPSLGGRPLGLFHPTGDGKITLNPELFTKGNEQQLARTMAHEIGHLIDYLPDKVGMKTGNLLGKLSVIRGFRRDFFEGSGISRTDKAIKAELINWTQYWKPFDPETATDYYKKYRYSPEELYADFISGLFNDPLKVQDIAPEAYNVFFKRLDEKPAVKQAYFELQQLLSGTREDVLKARSQDIRAGFEKAEALQKEFQARKDLARKSIWERLRQQVDDINYPILKKQKELEAKGQSLPEEESPKFLLEEQSFVDNENFLMMYDINEKIDQPLQRAGLSREDFGEYLFLKRVVGKDNVPEEALSEDAVKGDKPVGTDRQNLANPFGFQVESAQEQLDFMKTSMGEEKFNLLEESAKKLHDIVFKSVEEAVNTGAYNKEVFENKIKPNKDTYVTFAVVDYLQDKMPATVKMQKGTLKEIANPYISTLLKTIALNRLNAYQRAKVATKALLEKTGDIAPSKKITDGKLTLFKVAPDKGEFTLLENGKLASYDVDPYIAESFKRDKIGDLNSIVWLLDTFNNKLFKPMVTTYNLGFAATFNPVRDFKRNYKIIPNATVAGLLKAYAKSFPSAIKYTKGELDDFTRSLVESKAISAPVNDYQFDMSDDSEYQRILERFGLLPKKDGGILSSGGKPVQLAKVLLKPVTKTLAGMEFIANTLEVVSKIAGAKIRIAGGESGKELAYNLRNYTGTPNYRRKGSQTRTTNAVFTFSNIMKEGLKTDFQIATNPKTRTGYWWKTTKIDLLPKFLMFLATAGYLGKTLKDFYDRASEYDKTNYILIPLGVENGKSVYMRIPHDETGRLVSAIFWKMANFAKEHRTQDLSDIFAFGAGQLPQVNPAITIAENWVQYLSGRNPYDAFHGRTLIDDTTFTAGGGPALKKMAEWTVSELGLATFATYDTSKDSTTETFLRIAPWFNRVIKSTDYGITEKLNQNITDEKKKTAQTTLLKRDVIQEAAKNIRYPDELTNTLLSDLEKKIYGPDSNDKATRTNIRKAILKEVLKHDSPEIDSLLSATTNAQKEAILGDVKDRLSTEDYSALLEKLVEYKVISSEVKGKMQ